jgi:hypothetical protein
MKKAFSIIITIVCGIWLTALAVPSSAYHEKLSEHEAKANTAGSNMARTMEYCLSSRSDVDEDRNLIESSQVASAFPLYGSREEKVFRPSATLFSYDGNLDFKPKKLLDRQQKQPSRDCIIVRELAPQ